MDIKQIENLIYEYHWRVKELYRIEGILNTPTRNNFNHLVAQYGIDAVMPSGSKGLSHEELDNIDAREKRLLKRMYEYQKKVNAIENMVNALKDEQHLIILDCMMDGMSYRSIADHLGVGRTKMGEMKDDMLNQISQNGQFDSDLVGVV